MDRRLRSWATRLGRIQRRLEESDGRRVARRHAREELDKLLGQIRRELHKDFPNISKDGQPVLHEIPLPAGFKSCPLCRAYTATFRKLADHILDHHGAKCPCGYEPKGIVKARKGGWIGPNAVLPVGASYPEYKTRPASKFGGSQMTGHLRGVQEDLKTHVLIGAIGSQGQPGPEVKMVYLK